jgi:tetratricopeptide (TPR) repeat protein
MGFQASLYQEKKDYGDAIELAKKMVSLDPNNDKFHFTLGALYDENNQKELGVAEMRKAIELNPSNAPASGDQARRSLTASQRQVPMPAAATAARSRADAEPRSSSSPDVLFIG